MATFNAGNFSASDLQAEILAKMDQVWINDNTRKAYITDPTAFNALATYPSIRVTEAEQQRFFNDAFNCQDLKVSFLLDGDTTAPATAETVDDCDITGPEVGSDSITYAKPGGKEKTLSVVEQRCPGLHSFVETVAFGLYTKRKLLVKQQPQDMISFLITNASDLSVANISFEKGGVDGAGPVDEWHIGATPVMEDDMIAINHFIEDHDYIAPIHLTGKRFRTEARKLINTVGGGTSNQAPLLLSPDYPIVRDTRFFDTLATSEDWMMIDRAALAYVNYNYAQSYEIMETGNMNLKHPYTFRWDDPELLVYDPTTGNVRPYVWDVTMMRKCVGRSQFSVHFAIRGNGGWILAPTDLTNRPVITHVKWEAHVP